MHTLIVLLFHPAGLQFVGLIVVPFLWTITNQTYILTSNAYLLESTEHTDSKNVNSRHDDSPHLVVCPIGKFEQIKLVKHSLCFVRLIIWVLWDKIFIFLSNDITSVGIVVSSCDYPLEIFLRQRTLIYQLWIVCKSMRNWLAKP